MNPDFITGVTAGNIDIAVDSTHIYWADNSGSTIGRANINGTGVSNKFITTTTAPFGVAVSG